MYNVIDLPYIVLCTSPMSKRKRHPDAESRGLRWQMLRLPMLPKQGTKLRF